MKMPIVSTTRPFGKVSRLSSQTQTLTLLPTPTVDKNRINQSRVESKVPQTPTCIGEYDLPPGVHSERLIDTADTQEPIIKLLSNWTTKIHQGTNQSLRNVNRDDTRTTSILIPLKHRTKRAVSQGNQQDYRHKQLTS
jgi:hypothetical protein